MALRRFRKERTYQWKSGNVVSLGQLKDPIAILHAIKEGVPDTGVFDEKVRPFLRTLSAVDDGMLTMDGVERADAQGQCVFVIRDEGHTIGSSDLIVWGSEVFKVLGVKKHRGLTPFMEITTAPYGNVATCGFTLDETMTVTQPGDSAALEATNPFWTD